MKITNTIRRFAPGSLLYFSHHMFSTAAMAITPAQRGSIAPLHGSGSDATEAESSIDNSSEEPKEYVPPKVWQVDPDLGGTWGSINRPTAGARFDKELPVGKHPLQLYSLATPNGQKVTIMLEELVEAGVLSNYDAWLIKIGSEDQFGSGFVSINPNSKIPALVDHSVATDEEGPLNVFESGSILLYLAEKYDKFFPSQDNLRQRTEAMNWLMWQMGSAPFLGGGFGHFFRYAPVKIEYAINRYTMEAKRQLDVLDKHLATRQYMLGSDYSLVDMAIWPWYGQLALGNSYDDSFEFLDIESSYPNLIRWAKEIANRPAVKRGIMVNRNWGPLEEQLWERHDSSDFESMTEAAKELKKRDLEEEEAQTSEPIAKKVQSSSRTSI